MADDNFLDIKTRILEKMNQYEGRLKETNSLVRQMLGQQQMMLDLQQQFNERQQTLASGSSKEAHDMKEDLGASKKMIFEDHEERLRRLEEFMRRAS